MSLQGITLQKPLSNSISRDVTANSLHTSILHKQLISLPGCAQARSLPASSCFLNAHRHGRQDTIPKATEAVFSAPRKTNNSSKDTSKNLEVMSWMRWLGLYMIRSTTGNGPCRVFLCILRVLVHLQQSHEMLPRSVECRHFNSGSVFPSRQLVKLRWNIVTR